MLFVDVFTLLLALWLSFVLRLGDPFPAEYIVPSWWLFVTIPLIMIPVFIKLGLYRAVLQYIGVKVITTTFQATTIACLIVGFFMMFFRESNLPRSVLPIFWFIVTRQTAMLIQIAPKFCAGGYGPFQKLLYGCQNPSR